MNSELENGKRSEFRQILTELASSETVLQDPEYYKQLINKLKKIYSVESGISFRHFYLDIFAELTMIDSEEENYEKCSIDILGENVHQVWVRVCDSCEYEPFKLCIKKLYDHVNLDIARINYVKVIDQRSEKSKEELNSKAEDLTKELRTLSENLETKTQNMQKDYTTILGIFASIVLTFVASMVFSTAVLSNIDKASIYRILMIVWALGFILINILHMLISFVNSMNSRGKRSSIFSKIFSKLEADDEYRFDIKKVNTYFLWIAAAILLAWLFDIKNLRDMFSLFINNKISGQ